MYTVAILFVFITFTGMRVQHRSTMIHFRKVRAVVRLAEISSYSIVLFSGIELRWSDLKTKCLYTLSCLACLQPFFFFLSRQYI